MKVDSTSSSQRFAPPRNESRNVNRIMFDLRVEDSLLQMANATRGKNFVVDTITQYICKVPSSF